MTPYVFFGLGVLIVVGLGWWTPDPDNRMGYIARSEGLTALGGVLLVIATHWSFYRLHWRALSNMMVDFYLVVGIFLTACAVFRFRFYWRVVEVWSFFEEMTDTGRRLALGAVGVACLVGAAYSSQRVLRAEAWCRHAYATAANISDSIRIPETIPDSSLRMPRGRFTLLSSRPPFTCEELEEN